MSLAGFSGFDQAMQDPQTKNRLLRAMMGSDPSALEQPAENRIQDDLTRSPQGGTAELEREASRPRLVHAVQQQPSHLDQMQQQYDQMQPPTQKQPFSAGGLLRQVLGGALQGASGQIGARNQQMRQQNQQFEETRYDNERKSLAQQIEAERRMQEQNDLEDQRETAAYGRQLEQ